MGIFEGAARNDAAARAIALGRRQQLPIGARSLTATEIGRRSQKLVLILSVLPLLLVVILVLVAVAQGARGWRTLAIGLAVALCAAVVLHRISRARRRRHKDYVDPRIVVAVSDRGVRLQGPDGAHDMAFADARFDLALDWHHRSFRSSTADFIGIKLNSPLGRLSIEDGRYQGGRSVAAAICARCAAVGRRHGAA